MVNAPFGCTQEDYSNMNRVWLKENVHNKCIKCVILDLAHFTFSHMTLYLPEPEHGHSLGYKESPWWPVLPGPLGGIRTQ